MIACGKMCKFVDKPRNILQSQQNLFNLAIALLLLSQQLQKGLHGAGTDRIFL